MPKVDLGLVAAIFAPFFIALSILTVKAVGPDVPALSIAGFGSLLAVPFLMGLYALSGKRVKYKDILVKTPKPFFEVLLSRGIIGEILIIWGFTLTSAIKSILLLRLEPIFVLLWSVLLLKEKPTAAKFGLMSLLVLGTLFVVNPGDKVSALNLGDGLIILSLLVLSYGYVPTLKVVQKANPEGLNVLTSLIGGLVLSAVSFAIYGSDALPRNWSQVGAITAYTMTFFVFGCTLYFYAFKTIKPWIISSLLSLEVVFGLALALSMAGEQISFSQASGAAIMLGATVLIALYRKRESELEAKSNASAANNAVPASVS
jgi:drug/metabolite transporter (DMT)-like permease